MKRILLFLLLLTIHIAIFCYAEDITEDSFPAWSLPAGSVGIENFQHDKFSGALAYTVPLEVPPGTNGVQPSLTLRYFSGGGNSSVGNGWNINIGNITRSTRLGIPKFNDNDIFILQLNGTVSELVNIGGGQFRTKIESFLRINKSGTHWTVTDKSGTRYEYSYNIESINCYLTKIIDTRGNYVEITYSSSNNVGYIDQITYTKGNDLSKFRTIKFYYESRTDDYPDNSTSKTIKYNSRVDYIEVKVDGYLYKKYDFSYSYSPNSGKSLLTQIDEVGQDGTSKFLLAKFNYISNTIKLNFLKYISSPPPWDITDKYTRVGDVNGDGYPDLFKIDSESIKVALNNNSGWGEVKEYSKEGFDFDTYRANVQLGDVNGDGRDDIIKSSKYVNLTAQYRVAYNNGNGWDKPVEIENTNSWSPFFYNLCYSWVQLAYVNNDKYIDIIRANGDPSACANGYMTATDFFVCYGNGHGWDDPVKVLSVPYHFMLGNHDITRNLISGTTYYRCGARLADINGDGLADLIASRHSVWENEFKFWYILANGSSWDGVIRELPASEIFNLQQSATKVFDINKDGFADLISGRTYDGDLKYRYHLGNGKGFGEERSLEDHPEWASSNRNILFLDCDKDGIVDSLYANGKIFASCSLDAPQDDLLKEVTNRYGGKITFAYKSPCRDGTVFPFSLAVLESTTVDGGIEASPAGTTQYHYENGSYDIQNKIFRGFGRVRTIDPRSFHSHVYFHQDDSKLGKPKEEADYYTQKTVYTYKEDDSAPYFTPVTQIEKYTDSKCAKTTYEYDDYGNVTKTVYYGDKDSSGDEKCVLTDYALNPSIWLVNLLSRERIFSGTTDSGSPLSETLYLYDNNADYTASPAKGDLTKVRQFLDTNNSYIETASVYDSYGNEIENIDPNGNKTTIGYDSEYHTFPAIITNAQGHIEKNNYYAPSEAKGLFGQLKEKIDPNGNKAIFEYDTFGRKTKVIGPYDTGSTYGSQSYEYGIGGPGLNYILTRTTEENNSNKHHIKVDILDGFEKAIQISQESEDEQTYSYITTNFNKRGEIEKVSLPYFKSGGLKTSYLSPDAAVKWTQNTYDAIGRITKVTKPDGTTISNYYSGWTTTVTDELHWPKIFEKDAYGRLVQVKEDNRDQTYVTKYSYGVLGNLTKIIDNQSNQTDFTYDSLSRRISMNDPDLGIWSYSYDNTGNLIKRINAKGNIINYTYDKINRLINKNYEKEGIDIEYTYDEKSSTNGIGKRTGMEDLSGTARWHYDKEGRAVKEERVIDGKNYKLEWAYDAMGRVKSLIYPNSETVNFSYNNAGYLEGIDDYCLGSNYNAAGQIEQINFKNSLSTNFEYYPLNSRLSRINTGSLQDLNYIYSNVGNIIRINDIIQSTVKSYAYDHLNRLLWDNSNDYEYDSIGNLIKKNGVVFSYSSAHPHALIDNGQNSYSYDEVGNMISGAGRDITYDAENRPIEISKDGVVTYFVYDGDGKRVKKIVDNTSGITTTVYIGNLYEEEFVE